MKAVSVVTGACDDRIGRCYVNSSPPRCASRSAALRRCSRLAGCGIKGPLQPPPGAHGAAATAAAGAGVELPSGDRTPRVSDFAYRDGELYAERVPLAAIAARFGTPAYVYSRAALEPRIARFDGAFAGTPHLVCYAMKANSNLAVLDLLARLGSGFDIVSGGELARVLAAGGDPRAVVFSGVGKTVAEMEAALAAGILCFNVESAAELERLAGVAARHAAGARR